MLLTTSRAAMICFGSITGATRKSASARIINERPDQICGQQVGRELQPLKTGLNTGGHCFDRERFGQTRNALKQEMTIGEQPEQKAIDQIFLTDDNVSDLLANGRNPLAKFSYLLRNLLRRLHTV